MSQSLPIHYFYHLFIYGMVNVIRQMAPLFSKVDSNILLWHDVQKEGTVIYAKFGKDLFNISKVRPICRKTKWPRLFGLTR